MSARLIRVIKSALISVLLGALPADAQTSRPKQLPPTITLSSELVTEIALYLQDRPYREVAGLLGALQEAIDQQTRRPGEQSKTLGEPPSATARPTP